MPLVEDLVQRSDEWLMHRLGCCTGSRVKDILPLKSKKYSDKREKYMLEVVFERLSGLHIDHYVTPAMEYGIVNEDAARNAYEAFTGEFVDQVGLALHPTINYYCASPDGLVGTDGCIEIKVPQPLTHLEWIRTGDVPEEHIPQMKAVMACAERKWCDFVSYCPKMPTNLQLFVRRLEWDREMIEAQDAEVIKFLAEAAELEKGLRELKV